MCAQNVYIVDPGGITEDHNVKGRHKACPYGYCETLRLILNNSPAPINDDTVFDPP